MADIIVIVILLLVVGGAVTYIIKEKKKGVTCIGCPSAGQCQRAKQGGCHSTPSNK